MATLVSIAVTSFLLLFLNLLGSCVEYFYNALLGSGFHTFSDLLDFIPRLMNVAGTGYDILRVLQMISFALAMIILIISAVKSIISPMSGKMTENPINIVVRGAIAFIAIAMYQFVVRDYVIDFLNKIVTDTVLFKTSIPDGTLASAWNVGSAIFNKDALFNIIFYIAILVGMISAGIIYMERYLSFAMYLLLGPICLAFYPSAESRSITSEWLKGVISQIISILICMFAMSLVGYSLEAMAHTTSLMQLAITLTLLSFVKNSEQFVNMLGFKTMPNMDTYRSLMSGVAGAMAIPRIVKGAVGTVAGIPQGTKEAKEVAGKFGADKTGAFGIGSVKAKEAQSKFFNRQALAGYKNFEGQDRAKTLGKGIADLTINKAGPGAKTVTGSRKEFDKLYDQLGTDGTSSGIWASRAGVKKRDKNNTKDNFERRGFTAASKEREAAYVAYKEQIDLANRGKNKIADGASVISGEEFTAANALGLSGKRIVSDAIKTQTGPDDANPGLTSQYRAKYTSMDPSGIREREADGIIFSGSSPEENRANALRYTNDTIPTSIKDIDGNLDATQSAHLSGNIHDFDASGAVMVELDPKNPGTDYKTVENIYNPLKSYENSGIKTVNTENESGVTTMSVEELYGELAKPSDREPISFVSSDKMQKTVVQQSSDVPSFIQSQDIIQKPSVPTSTPMVETQPKVVEFTSGASNSNVTMNAQNIPNVQNEAVVQGNVPAQNNSSVIINNNQQTVIKESAPVQKDESNGSNDKPEQNKRVHFARKKKKR